MESSNTSGLKYPGEKYGPNTNQGKKIATLLKALKVKKRKVDHENDDGNVYEVEELHVNVGEFPALLKYCQNFLAKSATHYNQSILKAMPKLPNTAEKSREAVTKITPRKKRVKYIYQWN
ncbi:hypothetical protein Glove_101g3 [Diversispora epigaea]|uniref:Uncharacterized protein n=1 Tax=Diversispora epigaea TaxID=1348612 RepID=A0A397J3V1_9GLOM|nr:hypothetical protein Glove_101g3 [Diversispora epigaea]